MSPLIEKYVGISIEGTLDKDSEEAKSLTQKLYVISNNANHFLEETKNLLNSSMKIVGEFNKLCSKSALLDCYKVKTENYRELLKRLNENQEEATSK